ncbi:hypothetical protein [Roseibium sp. TrichSKD4]|uniref:hypothetical protein n=1 Tax=Roseibium sp. TrichSKD4 TaxID=744980 RepID=UPI0003131C56|nr:hypothetical protein [Roseibium sp. TrichSKD4]
MTGIIKGLFAQKNHHVGGHANFKAALHGHAHKTGTIAKPVAAKIQATANGAGQVGAGHAHAQATAQNAQTAHKGGGFLGGIFGKIASVVSGVVGTVTKLVGGILNIKAGLIGKLISAFTGLFGGGASVGGGHNHGGNVGGGHNHGGHNHGGNVGGGHNHGGHNHGGNVGGGHNHGSWNNGGNWGGGHNHGGWCGTKPNAGGNNAGWGVVNNNGTWQAVNGGGQQAQPQISAADQAVIDYVKGKEGKWLIGHGKYNHANGGYTFKEGPLKGYTAVHQGGGKYHINNGDGQKVADYNNGKGKDKVASPVALDLNGDGRISTTGVSTAQQRIDGQVGETIAFDIDGDGTKEQVEWITGGDGLVVDMTKIGANGEIDGNALMGDQGGRYTDGYQKMATYDQNGDGQLTGGEMANMGVWVDANGDGDVDAGELRSAAEAGVTQLSTQRNDVVNERGETLMQSSANNGQMLTEDVWFAQK